MFEWRRSELIKYKSHISTSEELNSNPSKCDYTYLEALELCEFNLGILFRTMKK
jgi:hypothetical protein